MPCPKLEFLFDLYNVGVFFHIRNTDFLCGWPGNYDNSIRSNSR